jgi:hypothetical protein
MCLGFFYTGDPDVIDTQPNQPTTSAACDNQAAATTTSNPDLYIPSLEEALVAKNRRFLAPDFVFEIIPKISEDRRVSPIFSQLSQPNTPPSYSPREY